MRYGQNLGKAAKGHAPHSSEERPSGALSEIRSADDQKGRAKRLET
jgi:hypothetical protein